MSLQRTDTNEPSKPLQELTQRNKLQLVQTNNELLKEALATSNEKCNGLIVQQNALIEGLGQKMTELEKRISWMELNLRYQITEASHQMEAESLKASQIKTEINQTVKSEITATASEMRDYEKSKIDENLSEIKTALSATANEIEKQREDMKIRGFWRKFFFWTTPVLLLAQTILLIIL